mmetsp:Transcript_67789/g.141339  ORF Transcript_67789/g.141339 Transcript_67789/m.141339 type:complete len:356 (-) Transcript_67789:59-1126(-)|eukprot:CAMPEP_0181301508 /NCGR_PEP_ID=MMETSP1101-20121128/7462_1 /TAXON_ID=46948 /ORGANISM="Rhodomonas abbreviata, Strain Caron Lab Isolate" /LENGTH=355 /DNA_ID=CAMNT_0023406819 /DNA_START=117 /DNA_END=1184 /DNA_ORIENTATION=+
MSSEEKEIKVPPSKLFIAFLVVSHMTVSSTMLVLNKAVLQQFKVPTIVLLFQVGSSAVILWVLGRVGALKVDPFEFTTAKAFAGNAIAFMVLLFTNAKALESANVESVIVFRTMSIFVTAYGDIKMLQARALSPGAIASLGLVLAGSVAYAASDAGFQVKNLAWVAAYGCANAAYPIVTKMVIRSKEMTSWGRTYYNNLMTFIVFLPSLFILGEHKTMSAMWNEEDEDSAITTNGIILLIMSCIWGTAISFLGFLCLENITATTFNVMGNANKILTLVVNATLWQHHASLLANLWLGMSLVGAGLYGHVKNQEKDLPPPAKSEPIGAGEGEMREMLVASATRDMEAGDEADLPAK